MKPQRKEELKHDEFAETLFWLWETVKLYQTEILIGVVVALVVTGGGMYVLNKWRQSTEAAWTQLAAVEQSLMEAQYEKSAKSASARSEAIKKYQALADAHPRSVIAPLALFRAGKLLLELGKQDEALTTLSRIIEDYPNSPVTWAAQLAKANALEDKKAFTEALALNEQIAASGPKHLVPEACLNAGRCAEYLNDASRARDLYQKAIAASPGSSWARWAEERLKAMAQKKAASAPPSEKKG